MNSNGRLRKAAEGNGWGRAKAAFLGLLLLSVAFRSGLAADAGPVKNPDTYTYLTISDADSLDPAYAYDTSSHMIILNVYEPLFAFKGSSLEELTPVIAEQVPTKKNKGISRDGRVYTIPIRKGVFFHDGTVLTPEDVRYSIMRFILSDRDAGPSSLLLQPLLGYASTRDAKGNLNHSAFKDAAKAVQVKGDKVILTLPKPYAPLLSILAQWSPIVCKSWAVVHGDWDGTEATWEKFNNPKKEGSPFFERANGTGPFMLTRWDRRTQEFVLDRFDRYWRGPAKLKRVVVKGVNEFSTRKLMLQAGDADSIYATAPEFNQLQNLPGVTILDGLAIVENNPIAFFTFKVNPVGNPFIGSGQLDGRGIPPDFFNDKDVRKGFAYSFDYKGYIKDVRLGKGSQGTGCIPKTLPGHNPAQKTYTYDLKQAAEHFKKAFGGKVWDTGFEFTLAFNSGNVERENLCQILKRSVESLNPKFKINVRPIEWPTFLDSYQASKLPIFVMGWAADFPDPHNFAFPLMHSQGNFPPTQHYDDPQADKLIDQAIGETEMAKRKKLYYKLQELEFEDAPHLIINDTTRYRPQRDWVQGYVHSPMFPDSPWGTYFYPIWKGYPKK
jgi:peptide/nickel transport system substrate-binding protein